MKKRQHYNRVSPYLIVDDVGKVSDFLKDVFDAEIIESLEFGDGTIAHSVARIGDSVIMSGRSKEEFPAMSNMIHVYVEDVDSTFQRAVEKGCTPVMKPCDQVYGDRACGIIGPASNIWWIATFKEIVSPDVVARSMEAG